MFVFTEKSKVTGLNGAKIVLKYIFAKGVDSVEIICIYENMTRIPAILC